MFPGYKQKAFKLSVIITYVTIKCDVYKLLNKDYIVLPKAKWNFSSHLTQFSFLYTFKILYHLLYPSAKGVVIIYVSRSFWITTFRNVSKNIAGLGIKTVQIENKLYVNGNKPCICKVQCLQKLCLTVINLIINYANVFISINWLTFVILFL